MCWLITFCILFPGDVIIALILFVSFNVTVCLFSKGIVIKVKFCIYGSKNYVTLRCRYVCILAPWNHLWLLYVIFFNWTHYDNLFDFRRIRTKLETYKMKLSTINYSYSLILKQKDRELIKTYWFNHFNRWYVTNVI